MTEQLPLSGTLQLTLKNRTIINALVSYSKTIVLPTEALLCKDKNCKSHYSDNEQFYDNIIFAIQIATSKCVPSSINGSKFKVIPGWNGYVPVVLCKMYVMVRLRDL